jgi:hypothetical protein
VSFVSNSKRKETKGEVMFISVSVEKAIENLRTSDLENIIKIIKQVLLERHDSLSIYEPTSDDERDGAHYAMKHEVKKIIDKLSEF